MTAGATAPNTADDGDALGAWLYEARRIDDWVKSAQPGDRLIYARMPALPAGSFPARCARQHRRAGIVELHHQRLVRGLTDYVMVRKAPPTPPASALRHVRPVLDRDCLAVKRLLRRFAREGRACPNNRKIAVLSGIRDSDRVAYALRRLRLAGALTTLIVHRSTGARVVCFPDGLQTALPGSIAR